MMKNLQNKISPITFLKVVTLELALSEVLCKHIKSSKKNILLASYLINFPIFNSFRHDPGGREKSTINFYFHTSL